MFEKETRQVSATIASLLSIFNTFEIDSHDVASDNNIDDVGLTTSTGENKFIRCIDDEMKKVNNESEERASSNKARLVGKAKTPLKLGMVRDLPLAVDSTRFNPISSEHKDAVVKFHSALVELYCAHAITDRLKTDHQIGTVELRHCFHCSRSTGSSEYSFLWNVAVPDSDDPVAMFGRCYMAKNARTYYEEGTHGEHMENPCPEDCRKPAMWEAEFIARSHHFGYHFKEN
eukprot:gene11713-12934_t